MGSFNEEYNKLRKKRLKEQEEQKSSVPYQRPLDTSSSTNNTPYTERVLSGDIAPIKTTPQKEEKWYDGWFKEGTFGGSIADFAQDLGTGLIGLGEKAVDFFAMLGQANTNQMLGESTQAEMAFSVLTGRDPQEAIDRNRSLQEETTKATTEFVKKDLYNEEDIANKILAGVYTVAQHNDGILTKEDLERAKEIYNDAYFYMAGDGETPSQMEMDSVFDVKSDSLIQSAGQLAGTAALQAVGVPWWVTSGATAFGSEAESALNQGATFEQAGLSGLVSAGAEILTEKIGGISFGGKTLGDVLSKKLAQGIASKFGRALIKLGIDAVGEGFEEALTEDISNFGRWLTYQNDKELAELLWSEEAMQAKIEAFIGGAALGGGSNVVSTVNSFVQGVDPVTELTKNEQAVFDKVYKAELEAKAEEKGSKLTNAEKTKIYDKVMKDLEKGYISTDTIEEVLGGEDYTNYKNELKRQQDIDNELNELRNMKSGEMTDIQIERMAELKGMTPNTEMTNALKFSIDEKIRNALSSERNGKGSYLFESYNEQTRRGQAFEADLSKYDTKQAEVIKKAIDSGILNNTNRTHDFVDMVAKISADKGVLFDFANNAKLKESGFAVDGKFVNGYVTKDGITVNIDSNKALNSIVGHEITHVLEGTELYAALKVSIQEYAKSKGDYQSRLDTLTKLYEGVEGADVSAELTADLVGDYLFTDEDFIKHLSTTNRNVFQRIYDEIKYLYKVATAGSKQARELEKVKRAFEKAYREGGKPESDVNTKYGISKTSKMSYENQLQLIEKGQLNGSNSLYIGTPSDKLQSVGFSDVPFAMNQSDYRKSRRESAKNKNYSSHAVPYEFFEKMPQYLSEAPMLIDNGTKVSIVSDYAMKDTKGNDSYVIAGIWANQSMESDTVNQVKSVYPLDDFIERITKSAEQGKLVLINKNKAEQMLATIGIQPSEVSRIISLTKGIISQNYEKSIGNAKFSLSDSDGKQLTKEQSEYFKDSKMRDDNGNLKVMYHGSQDAGFHIFDANMSDDDTSFFFVDRNDVAASYSGTSETYAPEAFKSVQDANKFFAEINATEYEVVENDGKYTLLEHGDEVATSDDLAEIYEEWRDWSGLGYGDANYKVYLNLTNPLEIDAKGRPWNKIDAEFSQEVYDKYQSLTAEEKAALVDLAEWEDFRIFNSEIQEAEGNELASAYAKMGEDVNIYDLFSVAADNFSEESMRENARHYLKTRDFAQRAKEGGYDGVIFKNIIDNGGYSNGDEGASTVAIAFESNQIKSVANDKPTADKDIRYSLSEDSKGRQLSKEQQEFFADSQIRVSEVDGWKNTISPDGALFPVYHGTNSDEFSEFDRDTIGSANDTGWYGKGFYFAFTEGEASYYGNRVLECYLNVKKPFFFSEEMNSYDGQTHGDVMFDFGAFVLNLSDKFPEIAQNTFIEVSDKGDYKDIVKKPFSELAQEIKSIYESDRFQAVEVEDQYEGTTYQYRFSRDIDSMEAPENIKKLIKDHWINDTWTADWLKEKGTITREEHNEIMDLFEKYGYTQFSDKWVHGKFDSKEYAEKNRLSAVISYLRDYKYGYFGQHMPEYFMEHYVGDSFTTELRDKGYDGILQSRFGDEIVVFDSNQIKLTNNKKPTSSPDINHSLSDTNEAPTKQYGSYNVYGKDIRLSGADDIAPVGVAENAITTEDNSADMGDEFAPVVNSYTIEQEIDEIGKEIEALVEESTDLYNKGEEAKAMELLERINELSTKDRQLREQVETLKAQEETEYKAYMDSLAEVEPPVETERAYSEADTTPLDDKTLKVLTRNVRNVLSAMPKENKAIREVIEKYSTTDQKKSELFRELKEKFGDKYEYHRYSDIAEAKKVLRTYKFNVSEQVKGDIADYRDYKKSHNVRTSKNALSVDVLYEELSGLYPGLFPADITNETDRFERISEVSVMPAAEWVKVAELSDNEIMQAVDFIHNEVTQHKNNATRKAAEADARAYIDDVAPSRAKEITENMSDPTLNYQGVYRETPIKTVKERLAEKLSNVEQELADNKRLRADSVVDFNREIARLQEEYNSKSNKNTQAANDILRRIERLQRMKNNVDADYEKRISDLEGKKTKLSEESRTGTSATEQAVMRAELHLKKIDNIRAKFAEKGLDFDKTLKKAKDLSTFTTVDNTPQRVMEKSLGYKAGQILADETVNKVAQNETEGIKWLNSYTDRKNGLLAQISKQYNIKPGSKESAAAQMYAEGFYVNKDNEIIKYGDNELAADFPNAKVRENIKALARDTRIRKIYDDTLDMINDSRARNAYPEIQKLDNYFLHFRAMDDTFSQLGLPFNPNDIRAKDLPTDLNGVTADLKPGQPYFASSMHREGLKTSYDLLGGLERYLSSAKNQIYHIDDIQTLRALRNHIADTYGQANGLEGLDALSEAEAQEKIKQVFNAHLSTFAKFLNEEANIIAGKTALIDRGFEGIFGRRAMTFMDTLNKQVGANMVGFNVSSSLTNFIAPVQAFAKTNKVAFVKGFAQTVSNKLGSIAGKTDGFAEKSPVMIRRKGADRFYRTPYQKLGDAGYVLMSAVDDISTEIIARAKYNELTAKGMGAEQAHFETDKWVSRLMGDRSLGQMPQLYNSKTLGLITKFQLEVRNQLDSQFYDTIQEAKADNATIENALARNAKTAAKVTSTFVQLAIAQHLFGKAFESIAGYNPAFDIIEVIMTALGFDDDEESEDTALDNIQQGFLALLEDLPYTSTLTGGRIPISSALPITQLIKGEDEYGNEKSRLETLGEIAPYYVLPGGYGQIKKTIQGLGMFSDDHPIAGSYTNSGKLRFPVDETFGNVAQAAIFGQYANENARDYFDNDIAPLNEKQTQEFIDVGMDIHDYWDYREGLSKYKTLAEKADYINSLDLTDEQKNVLINNIADRKEDIDMSDYDNYSSFEEFDYANKYPEKYEFWKQNGISYEDYASGDDDTKAAYNWAYENPDKFTLSKVVASDVVTYRQYTKELNDIKADKDSDGKSISGSRKEKVIDYINELDADYGSKIILFKSEYPADDTYNYDIVEYLNSRDDISYKEMETILKELGFNVDSNGRITWD